MPLTRMAPHLRSFWVMCSSMLIILMFCSFLLYRSSLRSLPSVVFEDKHKPVSLIRLKVNGADDPAEGLNVARAENSTVKRMDGMENPISDSVDFPFQRIGIPLDNETLNNAEVRMFVDGQKLASDIPFPFNPEAQGSFNMHEAGIEWDEKVGCSAFKKKHKALIDKYEKNGWVNSSSFQFPYRSCSAQKSQHITIGISQTTWIPSWIQSTYVCDCKLSCKIDKLENLISSGPPDAILLEGPGVQPTERRADTDPLVIFVDLEPDRDEGYDREHDNVDIWVGFGSNSDVQATYFGEFFHMFRNRYVSSVKRKDIPLYWASSRCLDWRDDKARSIFEKVQSHSFGGCANNVEGLKQTLMYPVCLFDQGSVETWGDHSHCVISFYKFALGIENTVKSGYVTEKIYYPLEAGAVPVYFGAPDVAEFLPPDSFINGDKYTVSELANLIKSLDKDSVAYMNYHAWRRCGVLGHFKRSRLLSLDTLPCRLCQKVVERKLQNS